MELYKGYELVVGLEIHTELKTDSKIFCSCKTDFGAAPNTQVCPVCLGHPGSMPVLNRKVVEYAVKAGLAVGCRISLYSRLDRKNYFYPDLPKAYQISQYDYPLCTDGFIDISEKRIGITRIHIEEDAGKLIHSADGKTLIDCNRCGVPLIEIVSEPDIRSSSEAVEFLKKLRTVILYTGISDCKMNEGSFRCDINLSVRKKGDTKLGTRTEIKNINSFQFVAKAIECEYVRQVDLIEQGEAVVQETRRFDADTGKTSSMRKKENLADYRFFAEPDIPPIELTEKDILKIKCQIPVLPDERKKKYVSEFGLTDYDSEIITSDIIVSDYFEKCAAITSFPKIAANMLITEILGNSDGNSITVQPEKLAEIADMSGKERINSATAKRIIKELLLNDFDVEKYVTDNRLEQINDIETLMVLASEVINENTKAKEDFLNGKTAALKVIIGKAMGKSGGRANPIILNKIILELLAM